MHIVNDIHRIIIHTCNLAKALLLAINGGRCENTGTVMVKDIPVLQETC